MKLRKKVKENQWKRSLKERNGTVNFFVLFLLLEVKKPVSILRQQQESRMRGQVFLLRTQGWSFREHRVLSIFREWLSLGPVLQFHAKETVVSRAEIWNPNGFYKALVRRELFWGSERHEDGIRNTRGGNDGREKAGKWNNWRERRRGKRREFTRKQEIERKSKKRVRAGEGNSAKKHLTRHFTHFANNRIKGETKLEFGNVQITELQDVIVTRSLNWSS